MFTKPLVLLYVSIFLVYANQAILTPTIPLYVTKLGGSASMAGLALMTFAFPSFLVRPALGRAADRIGHATMLMVGVASLTFAGGIFFAPFLVAVFIGSAARGVAWAATNIGGYSYLATASPIDRRGEATGYFTSVTSSATVAFPALALWMIGGHGGFGAVFAVSAAFAAAALPIAWWLHKHDHRERRAIATADSEAAQRSAVDAGSKAGVLNKGLIAAMLLSLGAGLPGPAVNAFLPLFARNEHVGDVSLYYPLAGMLTMLIRPLMGRRSDVLGQNVIIGAGLVFQLVGLAGIWLGHTQAIVLAGAVASALGPALIGSATFALALEAAPADRRGRAMAVFSMTYTVGLGLGSLMAGSLADLVGLRNMYLGPIAVTLAGGLILAAVRNSLPKPAALAPDPGDTPLPFPAGTDR